jgi:formylglycine-generating enzyme required for sulfatase activity
MAPLLGFEVRPDVKRVDKAMAEAAMPRLPQVEIGPPPAPSEMAPIPFWRLEKVEYLDDDSRSRDERPKPQKALLPADLQPLAPGPPPTRALAPWSRLWPVLYRAQSSDIAGKEPDLKRLLQRLSRAEQIRQIPMRQRSTWARTSVVLVDRSRRLTPFWFDQELVCHNLRRLAGSSVKVVRVMDGPDSPVIGRGGTDRSCWSFIPAGAPVLALTDLGLTSTPAGRTWRRFGRRLRRAGNPITALVPLPPSRWTQELSRLWQPHYWDRGRAGSGRCSNEELSERAERLLRLVSIANRVEPGLLRAVRLLLPQGQADAGTEADVWRHPAARSRSSVAMTIDPKAADRWRQELQQEPIELRRRLLALLEAWHACLNRAVWDEELLSIAEVDSEMAGHEQVIDARDRILGLAEAIAGDQWQRDERLGLRAWFQRVERRLPDTTWADEVLGDPLRRAWIAVHRGDPLAEIPPGLDLRDLDEVLGQPNPPLTWEARQLGDKVRFLPGQKGDDAPLAGSPLTPLTPLEAAHLLVRIAPGPAEPLSLKKQQVGSLPFGPTLQITSDREHRTLSLVTKPGWATAMGRDRYGLWAEIELRGVRQRMRWINPGRFMMGSPPGEAGRYDNEVQHQVTLTRGFWLAETPCTQAMWEAVMGENPSRFKSPDRPVETVSWDDVQSFVERVNEAVDGIRLRLPTEAEWENACRAGTTTSAYTGELVIEGLNNAPLLDGIAWYRGNSGVDFELEDGHDSSKWPEKQYDDSQAGTHPVAQKGRNGWGLYDMLGNVWEWCEDWYGEYPEGQQDDPTGTEKGSLRVLRGGSWFSSARYVRSAYRPGRRPGSRGNLTGFRLARGQE